MRFPPKLTAAQMFWTGVALVAVSVAMGAVNREVHGTIAASVTGTIATAASIVHLLGIGLVVGAFVTRAVDRRDDGR